MSKFEGAPNRVANNVRLGFTKQVFTPKAFQAGGKEKYIVQVRFEKTNPEHMAFLKQLAADAREVAEKMWPDESTRPRTPFVGATFSNPVKDGDTAINKLGVPYREKDPTLEGHYFISASSGTRPAVLNRDNSPILDDSVLYSGCYAQVGLNVYAYSMEGSRGITVGLNAIRKYGEGERLGGGAPDALAMFGDPLDASYDDPSNYDGGEETPFDTEQAKTAANANDPFAF